MGTLQHAKTKHPKNYSDMFKSLALTMSNTLLIFTVKKNYGNREDVVYTNYEALRVAFHTLAIYLDENASIAFPYMFGCGLANGDWNIVYELIEEYLSEFDVVIYKLN